MGVELSPKWRFSFLDTRWQPWGEGGKEEREWQGNFVSIHRVESVEEARGFWDLVDGVVI